MGLNLHVTSKRHFFGFYAEAKTILQFITQAFAEQSVFFFCLAAVAVMQWSIKAYDATVLRRDRGSPILLGNANSHISFIFLIKSEP